MEVGSASAHTQAVSHSGQDGQTEGWERVGVVTIYVVETPRSTIERVKI
jgi:hypothetical protein